MPNGWALQTGASATGPWANAQLVGSNPTIESVPRRAAHLLRDRALRLHFRLLFTGADIGSAAGAYPRCYVQLAEVGFYTLVSPSPPPPPALPPPPPLAPIDLSGTVPVTLVELFQAGAVTPTSGAFTQGDGETTTLQVITSYDPDAMNIHPSYPAARPADGIKATIDFVAAGYQHCVRVSGQIWMHSTVDPTATNGVIVEFSGVGEAPFALYQLCDVSPSCSRTTSAKRAACPSSTPSTVPVMSSGAAVSRLPTRATRIMIRRARG